MNRDDYIAGTVDHQTFYCAVVDAIGRAAIEHVVLGIASREEIARALEADPNLNNIPLHKWDRMDALVRNLVARTAKTVMPISWSAKAVQPTAETFIWSLCETVCVLKAAARRMIRETNVKEAV